MRRHVYRRGPLPDALGRTIDDANRSPAYPVMWGRNEFVLEGTLEGWDRRRDLRKIDVPTLVSCGRHDNFVPGCSEELRDGIERSELHVFDDSSHMSHLEETEAFLAVFGAFLDRAEAEVPRG